MTPIAWASTSTAKRFGCWKISVARDKLVKKTIFFIGSFLFNGVYLPSNL
jgi:hypothetical protein